MPYFSKRRAARERAGCRASSDWLVVWFCHRDLARDMRTQQRRKRARHGARAIFFLRRAARERIDSFCAAALVVTCRARRDRGAARAYSMYVPDRMHPRACAAPHTECRISHEPAVARRALRCAAVSVSTVATCRSAVEDDTRQRASSMRRANVGRRGHDERRRLRLHRCAPMPR